ncbi:MAG: hypothetical protein V1905_02170 [bacterium]
MGNKLDTKINKILTKTKELPFFDFSDLTGMEVNRDYLKTLFSRYEKAGKLVRLKKGFYVTKDYLDKLEKSGRFSVYSEFLSGILCPFSYLSLDYVLYKHNLLTEVPVNFTAIAKRKTTSFSNKFGNFFYHKIKDNLFCGYKATKENGFIIFSATKSKALFDYLYLRKNSIIGRGAVDGLRLNLDGLNGNDKKELMNYIKIEGSKKMREIYNYLLAKN